MYIKSSISAFNKLPKIPKNTETFYGKCFLVDNTESGTSNCLNDFSLKESVYCYVDTHERTA